MAILKMKRAYICALKKDRKQILEKLQAMGVMEPDRLLEDNDSLKEMDTGAARAGFDRNVAQCEAALSVLDTYAKENAGLLASLDGKESISKEEYQEVIANRDKTIDEASRIVKWDKEIAENNAQIQKIENEIEELAPWMSFNMPMNSRGTSKCSIITGMMPSETTTESMTKLLSEAATKENAFDFDIISSDRNGTAVSVMCMKEDAQAVEEAMRAAGFSRTPIMTGKTPVEKVEELSYKIEDLKEKNAGIEEEIKKSAKYREDIKRTSDYFRMRSQKYGVLGSLQQSESTFVISGYIPADAAPAIEKGIGETYDCFVEINDLEEGEDGPTALHNNKISETVEGVLKSYGLPTRGHIDPTFIMSIFYIIFFGMMLSDAGYGLVMAIGCLVVLLKKKNMGENMKKTLRMFLLCGLSTTFWGFMYGSFFGDAIDTIAKTFFGYTGEPILKAIWFEPLSDPMRLLLWCMLFGIIHLYFGLGIKGAEYLKQKDMVGFISDVVAWFLLLTGLLLMLVQSDLYASIAGKAFSFPQPVGLIAKIMAIAGAAIILLMSGRANKNLGVRIALGAYDLYGISGWLSDVLSYSRLLALGLATGVIANVINMMATMAGSGVIKVIVFIIVFILGHTLNLGINALGAYVHTNRLQFVEFFGKFYDGGGREFEPFTTDNKYIEIKEE